MRKYGLDVDLLQDIARGILMGKTLRDLEKETGLSRSRIHIWIHKFGLEVWGTRLYYEVLDQLQYNFKRKHLRGGQATSKYWREVRNAKHN